MAEKVLVTGAASGLGKALAELFAREGAAVAMLDLNKELLEKSGREIAEASGSKVITRAVDVGDYQAFKAAVEEAVSELGGIDIFVNNAGVGIVGEIHENTPEEIDKITRVNYLGMVYGSHIIIPHFYRQGRGHLVNVASAAGLHGYPRMSLYCGTKAGVLIFSEAVRFELKRRGIHVSVVLPSTTDTPMILEHLNDPDEKIPGILFAIPLCKTEKVAEAIYKGIRKKRFMIFPAIQDRASMWARNLCPWLFNLFIGLAGFYSFPKKREKLIRQYGLE